VAARVRFHEELVPLHEASAAAYHALLDGSHPAPSELEETRGLVAIALSRIATLYRMSGQTAVPLSESEIRQALFKGAAATWEARLRSLYIRRGALVRAVETLQTARVRFGGEPRS
jgi:hypothetical protein